VETTADQVLSRLLETVNGLVEMLEQAGQRSDVNIPSLKAQCLDLMFEAIKAGATRLASDDSLAPLQEGARRLVDRIAAYQRSSIDVRLHLIDLSQGWRCSSCGSDVAAAAALVSKAPLVGELVCKACRARTPLTARGEQRLQELFGTLASGPWNPMLSGFITDSGRK
jgi:hypothetical protein